MSIDLFDVGGLHVAAFHPSQLRVLVQPLGDNRARPWRAADAMRASGAAAVLDGPMFSVCSGQPSSPNPAQQYAASRCDELLYLHYDATAGLSVPSSLPSAGATLSVDAAGVVTWHRGATPADRARVAIQLNPVLVWDSDVQSTSSGGSNLDRVQRAALVQLEDGRLAFVTGAGTLAGFASSLGSIRVRYAGYTDGGGSTRLATRERWFGANENRPVPTWLAAVPPPNNLAWWLVSGMAAAGAAWLLWRHR